MNLGNLRPEKENRTDTGLLEAALNVLITEQRLTNLYLSQIWGEDLRIDIDLEDQ